MAKVAAISPILTFRAVRILGKVRESQSKKHMPRKHEDYGKPGMWCELIIPVLGGATGSLALVGQPVKHNQQDQGPNERLWLKK